MIRPFLIGGALALSLSGLCGRPAVADGFTAEASPGFLRVHRTPRIHPPRVRLARHRAVRILPPEIIHAYLQRLTTVPIYNEPPPRFPEP